MVDSGWDSRSQFKVLPRELGYPRALQGLAGGDGGACSVSQSQVPNRSQGLKSREMRPVKRMKASCWNLGEPYSGPRQKLGP